MSHPFWSGAIRLGLVDIPVSMQGATHSVDIDFDLVDVRDFAPIGYRKINKNTRREVPKDKIVRTFRVGKGEAVVVTEADFFRARPQGIRILEISGFLKLSEIPVSYFETPYYLDPAGKDAHGYVLLRDALKQSRKVALAHGVFRTRERFGALMPDGDLLTFNTLRYPHELGKHEAPESLGHAPAASSHELELTGRLIREMEEGWRPAAYHDRYRDELLAYLQRKSEAGEARKVFEPEKDAVTPSEPAAADLTELLERSFPVRDGAGHVRKRRSAS